MIRSSKCLLLAVAVFTLSTRSFAGAGGASSGVGNAGTVISLPDGSVVMSDPFVVRNNAPYQTFSNLNVAVQTQLILIGQFLTRYGAIPDQTHLSDSDMPGATPSAIDAQTVIKNLQEQYSRTAQSNFMVANVMSDQIHYHFMNAPLPSDCIQNEEQIIVPVTVDQGGAALVTPQASPSPGASPAMTIQMAACTIDKDTYIRQDLYADMDIRNQTMLLLHERLHSLEHTEHQNIIDITVGASNVLDIYRQQSLAIQNNLNPHFSDLPKLTGNQADLINYMVVGIVNMNYLLDGQPYDPDGEHWTVEPNGGGIYFSNPHQKDTDLVKDNAVVSPNGFIGVGSVLGRGGSLADGAVMTDSSCFTASCHIDSNALIMESNFSAANEDAQKFSVKLDSGSNVTGSQITVHSNDQSAVVHLSNDSQIISSSIQGIQGLEMGTGALIGQTILDFAGNGFTQLNIGPGSSTADVEATIVTFSGGPTSPTLQVSIPANQRLDLQMSNPFHCQQGFRSNLNSDLAITGLSSLTGLCSPILPPAPNN